MKIRRFTKFAFALVIAALIVGVPPWDQIQRSATPQMERSSIEKFPSVSFYH